MFSHLVESDLHKGELKRKGTFFLVTLTAYALLLMAAGVAGAYAYDARIEDQSLELVALVPTETDAVKSKEEARPTLRLKASNAPASADGQRSTGGIIKNSPNNVSDDLTKISGAAQAATQQTPPIVSDGSGRDFDLGRSNPFGTNRGGDGNSTGTNGDGGGNRVLREDAPVVKQQETVEKRVVNLGVVTSQALSLPQPVYPQLAKAAGVQGPVNVEIMIDETGRVISAHATSGNPLLRQESERAAYRARFTPTLLSKQPVKAKGIITYNFVLQR